MNRRGWVALALMFVLALAANTSRNSFQFFLAGIEADLGASRAAVAGAMSVFIVATGVLAPVAGRLVDRFSPRPVVAGGLTSLGVALLGAASASTAGEFTLWFGLVGGAGFAGVVGAPSQVFVTAWFRRRRALAVAVLSNAYSAGLLVLAPTWTALASGTGWRPAFTVMGVVLVGAGGVALAALSLPAHAPSPAQPRPSRSVRTGARAAGRDPALLVLLGGLFVCGTTMGIVDTHLVPLLADGGLPHHKVAALMSGLGGTIVLGGLAAGWLSDRLADRQRMLSGLFLLRVAAFALLAAPLGTWRFNAFVIVFGLSYTGVIPVTVAAVTEHDAITGLHGAVLGLGMLLHQLGGFAGVFGVGLLYDATGSYALPLAGAMALSALAAAAMLGAAGSDAPRPASVPQSP